MKYKAEVDNEKRNKSPRNDLLRNRICVGIIQAAQAHTHAGTYLQGQGCSDVVFPFLRPRRVWVKEPSAVRGSAAGEPHSGGGRQAGEASGLGRKSVFPRQVEHGRRPPN